MVISPGVVAASAVLVTASSGGLVASGTTAVCGNPAVVHPGTSTSEMVYWHWSPSGLMEMRLAKVAVPSVPLVVTEVSVHPSPVEVAVNVQPATGSPVVIVLPSSSTTVFCTLTWPIRVRSSFVNDAV